MPPFCESNFSFMAIQSVETIYYRLAKSSGVRTIRLAMYLMLSLVPGLDFGHVCFER